MKLYAPILLSLVALAACSEEPAPQAAPADVVAPEPTPSAPAPDETLFAELYAATCPEAEEAVNESICKRAMGAETAACEYSLGDDEYLRNDATLQLDETGEAWIIADAETVCTQ